MIDRNLQVSYLIVDLADTDLEMANDPFLEAGISIPKKLPLQPLENASKWNVIRNFVKIKQKTTFSSLESGDFGDNNKEEREQHIQKNVENSIEMSDQQNMRKNCITGNPTDFKDDEEVDFDKDTRGAK